MKLCCLSDTHGHHDSVKVPPCDILIHAGDFTRGDLGQGDFRAFLLWLERQAAPRKLLISGNHDGQSQLWPAKARELIAKTAPSVTYLHDGGVTIGGLRFWGSPYTPTFFDWYNMRDRGAPIRAHWDLIPDGTDVLITHGPPKGHLDWSDFGKEHCGCADLLDAVLRVKPKVHCFGHVHGPNGVATLGHDDGTMTTFHNVAICDEGYYPTRQPRVIDL